MTDNQVQLLILIAEGILNILMDFRHHPDDLAAFQREMREVLTKVIHERDQKRGLVTT